MVLPRPWEIWAVPFPFADQLAEKRRPALVISQPELCRDHRLVWLAMITSTRIGRWSSDIEVSDLTTAGLPIASRVRIAKIATLDPSRMLKRLGVLSQPDAEAVVRNVRRFLATRALMQLSSSRGFRRDALSPAGVLSV